MIRDNLLKCILANWSLKPTEGQAIALSELADFLYSTEVKPVFILRGYAGTGKTTVVSTLVRTLRQHKGKVVLMAPTGRAAKVFSLYSGMSAYTIHKQIYRMKSIVDQTVFMLDRNLNENTLFFVDEASMISDVNGEIPFGSGSLLDDLISYVYSGHGCAMVLLGDQAQLPPVGQESSPALNSSVLRRAGLTVYECDLTEVVRQLVDSGVLYNATRLRSALQTSNGSLMPGEYRFRLKGFADIFNINGNELIEEISECYSRDGIEETIIVCRSNRRAILYNNGIRASILDYEDELCRSDNLMVVKNNYYWTEKLLKETCTESFSGFMPEFLANGDTAKVLRVRKIREMYGFRFADVVLCLPDYGELEIEVTAMLDTLHSESASLTGEEHTRLYQNIMLDYEDVHSRKERMRLLRENNYYNAVQVKYAYAVTCHKAQGGQWRNVFIDQNGGVPMMEDREYGRWLYTALTRATERVFLINWDPAQIE